MSTAEPSPTAAGIRRALDTHTAGSPDFRAAMHCLANSLDDETRRAAEAQAAADRAEADRRAAAVASLTPEQRERIAARRRARRDNPVSTFGRNW